MPVESRMNRNVQVRFGGAGRGDGPSVRAALRPGSTLLRNRKSSLLLGIGEDARVIAEKLAGR